MHSTNARATSLLASLGLAATLWGPRDAAAEQSPELPAATIPASGAPVATTPSQPSPLAPLVLANAPAVERGDADPAGSLDAAFTQPAGSWTYHGALANAGLLGYSPYAFGGLFTNSLIFGFSDFVQGAITLQPLMTDNSFVRGSAALKAGVRTGGRSSLSAEIAFSLMRNYNGSVDHPWINIPAATLLATGCITADCASHLSARLQYTLYFSGNSDAGQMIHYGASLLQRMGTHVKLMLDVAVASYRSRGEFEKLRGFGLMYGVRFFATDIAADIGLSKPIGTGVGDDHIHFGLPSAAITYRWR
jgi:hypothetical protein